MKRRVLATLGGVLLLCGVHGPARAQETAPVNPEIERLKAQLAAQQQQIDQLRRTMEEEQKTFWSKPAGRSRRVWARWPAPRR
jgi:hypothetical protein